MAALAVWKPVLVNRSNRPVLAQNEDIVYIRDNIGLYQGQAKIVNRQSGRIYLTTQRVVYVDNAAAAAMSMAVDLRLVSRAEKIDKFFRSSPKIKLYIKDEFVDSAAEEPDSVIDWVCRICSFNNHLAANYDPKNLPKCVNCGVPPTQKYIESLKSQQKTAIAADKREDQCEKCTFINHPSMKFCEMCGSELRSSISPQLQQKIGKPPAAVEMNIKLEDEETYSSSQKYIKISFRKGGEVKFYELLTAQLDRIKWEKLMESGNVSKDAVLLNEQQAQKDVISGSGIYKLELISEQTRKQNELTLSTSLEDLEQLMYKAKDLIKLSYSFKSLIEPRFHTYPKQISVLNIQKSSELYPKELARHLSEYLTTYKLTKKSSMITTQDLFADYNRYLVHNQGFGTELVTAHEINRSIELFQQLGLPIELKKYDKSKLRVLQPKFNEDYQTIIVDFLRSQEREFKIQKFRTMLLHQDDQDHYLHDSFSYFRGNTISEISEHFHWSNDITIEEVGLLVSNALVVLDQDIAGTFYFTNKIAHYDFEKETADDSQLYERVENDIRNEQLRIDNDIKVSSSVTSLASRDPAENI